MFKIYGKVNINLVEHSPQIKAAIGKKIKGISLTECDERLIKEKTIIHIEKKNLLMKRMLDRFVAVFARSPSSYFISTGERSDLLDYPNMLYGLKVFTTSIPFNSYALNNVPEIIGLGSSAQSPTDTDRGLVAPLSRVTYGYPYLNTYNTREGGTDAMTRDNFILRCGILWDENYPNLYDTDINEIGLFSNEIHLGIHEWVLAGGRWKVDFTVPAGGSNNRVWEPLNLYGVEDMGAGTWYLKTYRRNDSGAFAPQSYLFDRTAQQIIYNDAGAPGIPPLHTNQLFLAYSPRYDSGINANWGSVLPFTDPPNNADLVNIPRMHARVVLPTTLTKTNNNILFVTWMIYLEETQP